MGSLDDNPPKIIGPQDYVAAVFLLPGDDAIRYWLMRSGQYTHVSQDEIRIRLGRVLKAIDERS